MLRRQSKRAVGAAIISECEVDLWENSNRRRVFESLVMSGIGVKHQQAHRGDCNMSTLPASSLYTLISLPATCAEAAVPSDATAVESPQETLALLQRQRHCHVMHLFITRYPQLLGDLETATAFVATLAAANPTTGMLLGIAALRCFTQHNFTGPSISGDLESDLQGFDNALDAGDGAREYLRDGGEEMYCCLPFRPPPPPSSYSPCPSF